MKLRLVAALLLAGAGALYLGVALPARRDTSVIVAELRLLRAQRRDVRSRLVTLERQETVRRRAAGALAPGADPAPSGGPARGGALALTRRAILTALEGAPVSGVHLEVRPAATPAAASVRLSAEGPSAEIVRLTGRLTQPGTGIVLSQVRLTPTSGGLLLDLEGLSTGGAP